MTWNGAGDLRFDWDGSLRIARGLWALADQIESLQSKRVTEAGEALVDWLGAFAVEFVERINTEVGSTTALARGLREGANAWAYQWKEAMDEQNRRRHAREERRVKDDRSWMDRNVWSLNGHDDLPPSPQPAAVPQAPSFQPTRGFVRY